MPLVLDSDASGPALDFVSAATDTGQARVPDTCSGADAGEFVTASSGAADAGLGEDAEIDNPFPADTPEAGIGTDTGTVTARSADADTGQGADTGTQPGASDRDAGQGADTGFLSSAAFSGSDAGHGTEAQSEAVAQSDSDASGAGSDTESVLKAVPVADVDASGAGVDAGEALTAHLNSRAFTSDASGTSADSEAQPGASDKDTGHGTDAGALNVFVSTDACHGTDSEELASAAFTGSDTGHGADAESPKMGPDARVSDSDSSAASDQAVIDVYAYQPLTRWDGGSFRAVAPRPRLQVPSPAHRAEPAGQVLVAAVLEPALRVTVEITADT